MVNYVENYDETLIKSSCVVIFWLSKDQSKITDIAGLNKFTNENITNDNYVQPNGGHHLYDFPRDMPRGRVELNNGKIRIYLGEDFPKDYEHNIKQQVIDIFNLEKYKDLIQIVYHYHWTTKDGKED